MDLFRTNFARHSFTLCSNHRSERKVIDICHALCDPEHIPILSDGSSDLETYLASRDIDSERMEERELESKPILILLLFFIAYFSLGVTITSIYMQISTSLFQNITKTADI